MATRALLHRGRLVAYMPSMQNTIKHFRGLSSFSGPRLENEFSSAVVDPQTDKPLSQLGPFNPLERMFPLPGRVAPLSSLDTSVGATDNQNQWLGNPDTVLDVLPSTPQEHVEKTMKDIQSDDMISKDLDLEMCEASAKPEPSFRLELQALQCSDRMKKEFSSLFPKEELKNKNMTVITVSQKTENDMSMWSPDAEDEREDLLQHFIYGAEDICHSLQEAGFWADFIDPSSGRPYLGDYTNSTLFETDERYRLLGFTINDLGCCKVLSHPVWGTHSYVGCIFTNTPVDHPVLQSLLK